MKTRRTIFFLAAGHGLNDLVAGYFLGSLVHLDTEVFRVSLGLILYNLLAFGGQYPIALLLEKFRRPKKFLLFSYGLNIIAIALFSFSPEPSIILAGVASALYHVAGGTVCARQNKAAHIGLFAAPGVVGLVAGGFFAYENVALNGWLLLSSLLFFLALIRLPIQHDGPDTRRPGNHDKDKFNLDQHDLIMILLLTVISLRSMIWNLFQLIHEHNYYWLVAIALSACVGKIFGGWLADRVGWRLYMIASLAIATPLITIFKKEMILFCLGVGLLQSGIPATTSLLIRSMKGNTERAIGLAFGLTIIVGAVVFYTPFRTWLYSDLSIWVIIACMLALMYLYSSRARASVNLPNP